MPKRQVADAVTPAAMEHAPGHEEWSATIEVRDGTPGPGAGAGRDRPRT